MNAATSVTPNSTHKATSVPCITPSDMGMSKKFIGSVPDDWIMYSDNASDYEIGLPIGFGASSIVYSAKYYPQLPSGTRGNPVPCAMKVLDLDSLPLRSLRLLQRETTLMSLSKHPNVLRVRGSWMDGHKLYIALRLMSSGSAADVMRYGWPGGMEEDVVRCILRQALQGLNYLHVNGFIHRDIKAANLLIDDDGTVLLGDLGVAADLTEDTSLSSSAQPRPAVSGPVYETRGQDSLKKMTAYDAALSATAHRPKMRKRKSFVGTPCWMAPELIQGRQYDSSADIWSFGITALELAQGRPPRSRERPQQVLLRIVQEDPPTLDRNGGTYKYSKAFKEMVETCLVKDPSKRPTAHELLQSPFFKAFKKKSYLVSAILKDLPPLAQRQERRPVPRTQTTKYIDSWDFATTIQSHYHTKLVAPLESPVAEDGDDLFEMEESNPRPPAQVNGRTAPIQVLSYPPSDGHDHITVISRQLDHTAKETDNLALSISVKSSNTSTSPNTSSSTAPLSNSPLPSPFEESVQSSASVKQQETAKADAPFLVGTPESNVSAASIRRQRSTSARPNGIPGGSHQASSSPKSPTMLSSSPGRSGSGFWKKIKDAAQRPPSRSSLASPVSLATDVSSASREQPLERKEKLGQMFSGVGRKKGGATP